VNDEQQRKDQGLRHANAIKFCGAGTLKQQDLSESNSLANLAFNVLAMRQPPANLRL